MPKRMDPMLVPPPDRPVSRPWRLCLLMGLTLLLILLALGSGAATLSRLMPAPAAAPAAR